MAGSDVQSLMQEISSEFASSPGVAAVVIAGSQVSGLSDGGSDLDLYVYADPEPALVWRADLARKFGEHASTGNAFWEPGDEWLALQSGSIIDIMYRSPAWIEQQLDRVLLKHQASVGYSTCFVYNVLHSRILFDRTGWFALLQGRAQQPYPEPLRRAIVAKNHPILRTTLSSYVQQIARALERDDRVSVNHRVTALLASYFDILFALNRQFHPGEKRLVAHVLAKCIKYPPDFETQVEALLSILASPSHAEVLEKIGVLLDGLDALLIEAELIVTEKVTRLAK